MIDLPNRPNLLKELDARQDDVLEQLERLNARVQALIGQFTVGGAGQLPASERELPIQ